MPTRTEQFVLDPLGEPEVTARNFALFRSGEIPFDAGVLVVRSDRLRETKALLPVILARNYVALNSIRTQNTLPPRVWPVVIKDLILNSTDQGEGIYLSIEAERLVANSPFFRRAQPLHDEVIEAIRANPEATFKLRRTGVPGIRVPASPPETLHEVDMCATALFPALDYRYRRLPYDEGVYCYTTRLDRMIYRIKLPR